MLTVKAPPGLCGACVDVGSEDHRRKPRQKSCARSRWMPSFLPLLGLLLMVGCAEAKVEPIVVQGAGASFPDLVYQDLLFAYQFIQPSVKLSYLATGSSGGQCRIMDFKEKCKDKFGVENIDFAGSDSLMKSADYQAFPDLQMFPSVLGLPYAVAGGMVPVYNVPGLDQTAGETLVVDRLTLSYIFMGNITKWNDPYILEVQSANVRAKLAARNQFIKLIVRKDGSGSTEVFTKSLDLFSNGEFSKYVGKPSSSKSVWEKPANKLNIQFEDFASGVAAGVLLNDYSIGYTSSGEAVLHDLPIPAFKQNIRQKSAIKATTKSIAFAMLEKGLQFGNNGDDPERLTADIMDASGDEAWPIATFTYVVLRNGLIRDRFREGATCANVQATVEFWNWVYSSELASTVIERAYFVPLPDLVKQPVLAKLRTMQCGDEPALKNAADQSFTRVVAAGVSDTVVENTLGLYASLYKSVDPLSEISVLGVQSSKVDVTKRLLSNEAFKVVIGDDVFRQEWVKQDLDKLLINGKPNKKKWSEIHPVTGADASLVLPWFTFAIHFVYNIPNQPEDKNLVLTPVTIKKILDGKASNWTDSDIAVENPWIASIVPPPGFIKMIVREHKDTIYEYLKNQLSDGFLSYELPETKRYKTWEQMTAIVTGVDGAFSYGRLLGEQPKNSKFASIKWTDAPNAVVPAYGTVFKCAIEPNAFSPDTLAYTPNPKVDGCYPLTLTVNVIFHHSYANLQEYCFVDLEKKKKGPGVAAVEFWKFMIEAGPDAEKAIVNLKAVPLLHTLNNTAQLEAALFMSSTIQCGHPPDVVEADMTQTIIIAACAGGGGLLLLMFVAHVVTTRHAMQSNPLKGVNVAKVVKEVHADILPISGGNVATYIPELGLVSPDLFAIAICTVDGKVFKYGDIDHEFSIQSMSKPLAYAHALVERGFEHMKTKVNVEPAGGAFDTMEMDDQKRPFNPFINSGAIATSCQLHGDTQERYEGFRKVMSGFCNKEVRLDHAIYKSESSTAARNRAIADKLFENKICESEYDKEHGLEAYFMMCSTLLNTVDLAVLAATCAHNGQNPISKKHIVPAGMNEEMMSVMMTCGMYNGAGNWMVDVGIPAKSGVSGGIFGVVPGVCGIAVFSPALNASYNSVRAIEACTALSQKLGLHVLQKKKSKITWKEVLTGRRNRVVPSSTGPVDSLDTQEKNRRASTLKRNSSVTPSPADAKLYPEPGWSDPNNTVTAISIVPQ